MLIPPSVDGQTSHFSGTGERVYYFVSEFNGKVLYLGKGTVSLLKENNTYLGPKHLKYLPTGHL